MWELRINDNSVRMIKLPYSTKGVATTEAIEATASVKNFEMKTAKDRDTLMEQSEILVEQSPLIEQ